MAWCDSSRPGASGAVICGSSSSSSKRRARNQRAQYVEREVERVRPAMSERPSPHEHGRRRRARALTLALWCGVGLGLAALQPVPESGEPQLSVPASAFSLAPTSPHLELAEVRQRVQALRQALAAGQPVSTTARQLLGAVEAAHGPFSLEAAAVLDLLVECGWRSGAATAPETQALAERSLRLHLVLA